MHWLRRLMYFARFLLVVLSIVLVTLEIVQILTGHQVGEQKFAVIAAMLAWVITLATAGGSSGFSGSAGELVQ